MHELTDIGILAFRSRKYDLAVSLFLQSIECNPESRLARVYLAISFQKAGWLLDEKDQLAWCPDEYLIAREHYVLPILNERIRKDLSCVNVAI